MYDSKQDTLKHIERVRYLLSEAQRNITYRAMIHDKSKLEEHEKSMFDEWTPKLQELEYGSDEYKYALEQLGPALQHHYENNSHHPEHYTNGVNDMSLFDLLEMLADWKAAGERHGNDVGLMRSMFINQERFDIQEPLFGVLLKTIVELGWQE